MPWEHKIQAGMGATAKKSLKVGCHRLMKMVDRHVHQNSRLLENKYRPKLAPISASVMRS